MGRFLANGRAIAEVGSSYLLIFVAITIAMFLLWLAYRLLTVKVLAAEDLLKPGAECDGEMNAVFAGSFNPPHIGHATLLRAMARQHRKGTLYAVVGHNPAKTYPVSPDARVALLRKICASDPELRNVEPVAVSGYIWRFALARRCLLYRGIRTMAKDGAEERFLHLLNLVGPLLLGGRFPATTIYVTCPARTGAPSGDDQGNLTGVSSSRVRGLLQQNMTIKGLVPAAIEEATARLYAPRH